MGTPVFNSTTGHYYDAVTSKAIKPADALTQAGNLTWRGLTGYLANITSSTENTAVYNIINPLAASLQGVYLFGASDAVSDNKWVWLAGPEKGIAVAYTNWDARSSEPNRFSGTSREDYIAINSDLGKWVDLGATAYSGTGGYIVEYGGLPATYALSASGATVSEGSSVVFTVETTNIEWGKTVAYTVTGISSSDLSAGALSGTAVVNQVGNKNIATISFTLADDKVAEVGEKMTVTVNGVSQTVGITDAAAVWKTYNGSPSLSGFLTGTTGNDKYYASVTAGTAYAIDRLNVVDLQGDAIVEAINNNGGYTESAIEVSSFQFGDGLISLKAQINDGYYPIGINGSTLTYGNGNSDTNVSVSGGVYGQVAIQGSTLSLGDGKDLVNVNLTWEGSSWPMVGMNNNQTDFGAGDDSLIITLNNTKPQLSSWGMTAGTTLMGAGNDTLTIHAVQGMQGANMQGGEGNDTLTVNSVMLSLESTSVQMGAGDDQVTLNESSPFGLSAKNSTIDLGPGTDTLTLKRGTVTVIGGDGTDTVVVKAMSSDYQWSFTGSDVLVKPLNDPFTSFTLRGVESLSFNDKVIALTQTNNSTAVNLGTVEGLTLNLINPVTTAAGKTYYILDSNGNGIFEIADEVGHDVLDKIFNSGNDTTDTQPSGAVKGVDDARSMVRGGFTVVLPTTTEFVALRNEFKNVFPTGWQPVDYDSPNFGTATRVGANVHNNVSFKSNVIYTNLTDGYYKGVVAVQLLGGNAAPTGSVLISGMPKQGATLVASHSIKDADGVGIVSYQWSANGTPIPGATANSLLLGAAQVGQTVSVQASYRDNSGNIENVQSSPTSVVTALNALTQHLGTPALSGYVQGSTGNDRYAASVTEGTAFAIDHFSVVDLQGDATVEAINNSNSYRESAVEVSDFQFGDGLINFKAEINGGYYPVGINASKLTFGGGDSIITVSLNGAIYAQTGIQASTLNLGDGKDAVSVTLTWEGATYPMVGMNNNQTDLGAGDDSLSITLTNAKIQLSSWGMTAGLTDMGAGNDSLSINAVQGMQGAKVSGGDGNDTLTINSVMLGMDSSTLDMGAGDDRIVLSESSADALSVKSAKIDLGAGNDWIELKRGTASVSGGDGNDTLYIKANQAGFSWKASGTDFIVTSSSDSFTTLTLNSIETLKFADGTVQLSGNSSAQVTRGNSKYVIVDGPSWTAAQAKAVQLGGHLVTINDKAEQDFIKTNLIDVYGPFLWIGLTDVVTEGNFKWISGEPVTYTNWSAGEPNNQNNEDYALTLRSGQWNDGHDNNPSQPMKGIAEIPLTPNPTVSINASQTTLKAGETATLTFAFSANPLDFTLSDITATNGEVANLAVLASDPQKYTALFTPSSNLAAGTATVSIADASFTNVNGAKGVGASSNFATIDTLAPKVLVTTPAQNASNVAIDANIVIKLDDPVIRGKGVASIETYSKDAKGFMSFGSSAYVLVDGPSWTEAEGNAVKLGGHLVAINSKAEQDFIKANFVDTVGPTLWIGATDQVQEGSFKWTTGEALSYTNWSSGEPNNLGNEDYVQTYADGTWNDLPNVWNLTKGIAEIPLSATSVHKTVVAQFDALTSSRLAIQGSTLTIDPIDNLQPGITYSFVMPEGFITDANGNSAAPLTVSFTTEPPKLPTYALSTDGTVSEVNEGASLKFLLKTTNLATGSQVPYQLSGTAITAGDLDGAALTGYLAVDATGAAALSLSLTADQFTEGSETLTLTVADKSLAVKINDTSTTAPITNPGVVFSDISNLTTTEAGGKGQFKVALAAAPRFDVKLTLTSNDTTEGLFDNGNAAASDTKVLTFTASNWNQTQSVMLVGVNDDATDGDIPYVVSTQVQSSDLNYDGMRSGMGLTVANVMAVNLDDDKPDSIIGTDVNDVLYGGPGPSDIYGSYGRDELYGGKGNDRLYGGYGDKCCTAKTVRTPWRASRAMTGWTAVVVTTL